MLVERSWRGFRRTAPWGCLGRGTRRAWKSACDSRQTSGGYERPHIESWSPAIGKGQSGHPRMKSVPPLGFLTLSLELGRAFPIDCILLSRNSRSLASKLRLESLRTLLVVPIFFLVLHVAPSFRLRLLPRISFLELLREIHEPIPALS